MIRSIGISIVAAVLAVSFTPTVAHAQATDAKTKKQIARFLAKLNKLPRGAAGPAKVKGFTKKLVKLDPKKSKRYFKIAVIRFPAALAVAKTGNLEKIVVRLLNKSDIGQGQIKRLVRVVGKIADRVVDPTPPPYQAALSPRIQRIG